MLTRRQFVAGAVTVMATVTGCRTRPAVPPADGLLPATGPLPGPGAAPPKDQALRVALLSDPHIQAEGPYAPTNNARLREAVDDLKQAGASVWLCCGDVSDHGRPAEFAAFKKILSPVAKPEQLLVTTGNHEFYDAATSDEQALRSFMDAFSLNQPYSNRVIGGLHFVMLADEMGKSAPRNRDWAWLTPAQLRWFEQVLNEHRDKFTVVSLHQPLQDTLNWSWGNNGFGGCGQVAELRAIIAKNPQIKLWLNGHTHIEVDARGQMAQKGGVTYACLGSTFYQFVSKSASGYEGGWPGPGGYRQDYDRSQSRLLEIWPERVVLRTRDHRQKVWLDDYEVILPRT